MRMSAVIVFINSYIVTAIRKEKELKKKKETTKKQTGFAVSFVIEYYSLSILSNAILTLWPESVNLLLYMKFCPQMQRI